MESLGLIYALYCSCPSCDPGEARYVGQTTRPLEVRFKSHLSPKTSEVTPRYKWIHEHGTRNILVRPLEERIDPKNLDDRERFWIQELKTFVLDNPRGCNATRGGDISLMDEDELHVLRSKRLLDNFNSKKLSWEDVREIRRLYSDTETHPDEIAERFGVGTGTVYSVVMNVTWKDPAYKYRVRSRKGLNTGAASAGARLDWESVREIRKRFCAGDKVSDIAKLFGTGVANVKDIGYMKTWPDPGYTPPTPDGLAALRKERRRRERVPREVAEEVHNMSALGAPYGEISRVLGLSEHDVRAVVRGTLYPELGPVERAQRRPKDPISDSTVTEIKRLSEAGLNQSQIARELGISNPTVRKYLS